MADAREFVFPAEKVGALPLTAPSPFVVAPLAAAGATGPLAVGCALGAAAAAAAENSPLHDFGAALAGAAGGASSFSCSALETSVPSVASAGFAS